VPSWQGKSNGTRAGYHIFVYILQKCGVFPAYFLLRFVACYYYLFSFRSSGFLYRYFRERMGYGRIRSLSRLYTNYLMFGQALIDRVVLMAGIPNRFSFDFDGEEHLHRMVALQQGGLLLSGHIGNWEIAGHLLKRLNTPIHIVMYDAEHQQIKEYLSRVTGERTASIIVIKDDLSHIYAISEALKNKELVCIHADRFVEGARTLSADFLGAPARFPAGPFILTTTYKVPVSFVFALKESALHYHFFASDIKQYDFGARDRTAGLLQVLNDFAKAMEEKVKKYPEQWYNYYNFWQP
jgi:predicted LPLAT superfamily acyltransferase